MSKNNHKNNGQQKTPEPTPSRRGFLKYALGSLGGLVLLGGSGYGIKKLLEDDPWGFLYESINLNENVVPDNGKIPDILVPLGGEKQIERGQPELETTIKQIMLEADEELTRLGWQNVKLNLVQRDYGKCEREKYALQYLNYIYKALDFLYQKLPQLRKIDFIFNILKPGDDYSENAAGKAFIGLTWHRISTAKIINTLTGKSLDRLYVTSNEGSVIDFNYNKKTNSSSNRWIFFGAGKSALAALFSETLHCATMLETDKYVKKVGMEKALQATETLSESLSYFLTKDMIDLLRVPRGHELHNQASEMIRNGQGKFGQYSSVPQAIDWLKNNSLQKGLDLYLENPEKFMAAVTHS